MKPELIAIGASAGGIQAVQKILLNLNSDFQTPLVVVQHLPPTSRSQIELSFSKFTNLKTVEIEDKMPIENHTVYFAPPGYHLLVERENCFALSVDEPVHFSRPSIDVFFESAANVYKHSLVGVLLTGANEDGARGLMTIKERGGVSVVQDPATAEIQTMPQAALKLFKPDFVEPLAQIPFILNRFERGDVSGENQDLNR